MLNFMYREVSLVFILPRTNWEKITVYFNYTRCNLCPLLQFVNFTKIMSENADVSKKEAAFALAALMEIPLQYRATLSRRYSE